MIYFMIPVFIILFLMAIWDVRTETIPHTLTILLLIFGLINTFVFAKDFKLPLFTAIGTFIIYAILFFITDKIGEADVKILAISMLFINDINALLIYCIIFASAMMTGVIITLLKNKKSLRLGPYMSLGVMLTIIYTNFTTNLQTLGLVLAINIILLYSINTYFYYRKDVYELYETAKYDKEKINKLNKE